MPDITMCQRKDCKRKKKCYRFTATPSEYMQSYFWFKDDFDPEKCENFWEIKLEDK